MVLLRGSELEVNDWGQTLVFLYNFNVRTIVEVQIGVEVGIHISRMRVGVVSLLLRGYLQNERVTRLRCEID